MQVNQLDVSVIMGVFNEEDTLSKTIDSILNQKSCNFEFIIVNDGSIDNTKNILDEYATKDTRIKIIHQENTGLTQALINGCKKAKGQYIARQDSGDISLPDRLKIQKDYLDNNPNTVMAGCGVNIVAPDGELLYSIIREGKKLDIGLRQRDEKKIEGPPHHSGTMFCRKTYKKAGGYRAEFKVAQDTDLWIRLSELGKCKGNAEVLCEITLETGRISSNRRLEQQYFVKTALQSAECRRNKQDEQSLLANINPPKTPKKNKSDADFYYFIAASLQNNNPKASKKYLKKALQENPFHFKARFRQLFK